MPPTSAPVHHQRPILEIVHRKLDYADHRIEEASALASGFKAVAASHAFRHYGLLNVLQNTFPTNVTGNFRGMVVSARWKTVFHYISEQGENLENVGTIVSFASNVAEMGHEFEAVHHHETDLTLKAMRYAALAGTAAERTLAGLVTGGVHLTYKSMQGYCMMLGLLGGSAQSAANQCITTLDHADYFVQTSVKRITDTSNQAHAMYHPGQAAKEAYWWVVNMQFLPR
jgi:hypothetical protein